MFVKALTHVGMHVGIHEGIHVGIHVGIHGGSVGRAMARPYLSCDPYPLYYVTPTPHATPADIPTCCPVIMSMDLTDLDLPST